MAGRINDLFGAFLIKKSLRTHAADNTAPAHGDVGVFVGQENGGADTVIAASGRVGAINARHDGNPQFFQLRVSKKGRASSTPVRIDFLLFGEFYPTAVHQPHQRNSQAFGNVRHPQVVFRLAGNPGARHDLVVKADHHCPFAADLCQPVDHTGSSLFIEVGVEQGMERTPCPRVYEVFDPFPDRQLTPFMDHLGGQTGILDLLCRRCYVLLHFLNLCRILGKAFPLLVAERPPDGCHFLKIWSHSFPPSS